MRGQFGTGEEERQREGSLGLQYTKQQTAGSGALPS